MPFLMFLLAILYSAFLLWYSIKQICNQGLLKFQTCPLFIFKYKMSFIFLNNNKTRPSVIFHPKSWKSQVLSFINRPTNCCEREAQIVARWWWAY